MAQTVVPWVPVGAYDWWVARGVDWLVMSEDLPTPENRITRGLSAAASRCTTSRTISKAHRRLVRETKRILRRLGFR